MYANLVNLSDSDLSQVFSDLNRRGISLALEFGPLTSSQGCGIGIEGFNGSAAQSIANKIKLNGGMLKYLALDEPFYYGSLYNGPGACGWSAQTVATNTAATISILKAAFPGLLIGDSEPIPASALASDWLQRYAGWLDTFQSVTGSKLQFVHAEALTDVPTWTDDLAAIRVETAKRSIPFGVIYTGRVSDSSDAQWASHAEANFTAYELTHGTPDQVVFQSWMPYPVHILPETDPTTFSALIGRYSRSRTAITISLSNGSVAARLADGQNRPVANSPVVFQAVPVAGPGTNGTQTLTGIVPPGASTAIIGIRANVECGCSGAADLSIRSLQYAELAGSNAMGFSLASGFQEWGLSPASAASLATMDGSASTRISLDSSQAFSANSPAFRVAGGAAYTFTLNGRVSPSSTGHGYFGLLFFNGTGREISRDELFFTPNPIPVGTGTTDATGVLQLPVPSLPPADYVLQASFAGTSTFWPALGTAKLSERPVFTADSVLNAASYAPGAIAPGELITVFGTDLAPIALSVASPGPNGFGLTLAGTSVTFDGIPAPLIYTSGNQIAVAAPFALAGKSTTMVQIVTQGVLSDAIQVPVSQEMPALFSADSSGRGQGAILNQNTSVNGLGNPASRGSIVVLFGTGGGLTSPNPVDGSLNSGLSPLQLPVSAQIGGRPAEILYAGGAPGLIAGVFQINVKIPDATPVGDAVPVIVKVGNSSTQPGLTVAVR